MLLNKVTKFITIFDEKLVENIVKQEGLFDVVVFTNVFARIDDLKNLLLNTKSAQKMAC